MPRISAASIAEHVATQEEAVVRAAIGLFTERGAARVTMADIAAEVGLARNSLYRYFPDKSHIVATWFRRELGPLLAASEAVADDGSPPTERLVSWISLHLGYLSTPEHRRMLQAVAAIDELSVPLREEIGEGHERLYRSLGRILGELGCSSDVVLRLIVSMVRAGADLVGPDHTLAEMTEEVSRAALAVAGA